MFLVEQFYQRDVCLGSYLKFMYSLVARRKIIITDKKFKLPQI